MLLRGSLIRYVFFNGCFIVLNRVQQACYNKFIKIICKQGLSACEVHPTVFRKTTSASCVFLVVYVDDTFIKRISIHHLTIRDLG